MNKNILLSYLKDENALANMSYDDIQHAILEYPYCQNLHFLLAKKSHLENHPDFDKHLHRAATYMSSRGFLKQKLKASDNPANEVIMGELAQDENPKLDEEEPPATPLSDTDKNLPIVTFIADEMKEANRKADERHLSPPIDRVEVKPQSAENPLTKESNIIDDISEIFVEESKINTTTVEPSFTEKPTTSTIDEEDIENDKASINPGDSKGSHNADIDASHEPYTLEGIEEPEKEDEIEDLLNSPLIEVVKSPFSKSSSPSLSYSEEEHNSPIDSSADGSEDLNELLKAETEISNNIKLSPKLSKWIKKYEASKEQRTLKGENNATKTPKKKKKKAKKSELIEEKIKLKEDKKRKKKHKKKETKKKKKKDIKAFAEKSVVPNEEIVSETLANILIAQGNISKGIAMMEKLMLIFPEKKAFFVTRIENLKNL